MGTAQDDLLALIAMLQFWTGKYDNATNTFLDLVVNPAKVAGWLAVRRVSVLCYLQQRRLLWTTLLLRAEEGRA